MAKLPYPSLAGPALALLNNKLFVAWADRDTHALNVAHGMEVNETHQYVVGAETTFTAPALAEHNGRLYIAWAGEDGGHHLNVRASNDGITWPDSDKRTIWTDFTNVGPSLVSYLNRLYLVYTGTDSHIYLIPSDNGLDFIPDDRIRLVQTASDAPAASARTTQNGDPQFFLAWTGGGNRINYLECEGTNFDHLNTSTPGFFDESHSGPALSTNSIEVDLMYRSLDRDSFCQIGAGEGTININNEWRTHYADTSRFRPALARGDNFPEWAAWVGMDGDQSLNVAGIGSMQTV
jgi:hypothetical protein